MSRAVLELPTTEYLRLRDRIDAVFSAARFGDFSDDERLTILTDEDCRRGGSEVSELLSGEDIPFRLTWGSESEFDVGSMSHLPDHNLVKVTVVEGESDPIVCVRDGEPDPAELQDDKAFCMALTSFRSVVEARPVNSSLEPSP